MKKLPAVRPRYVPSHKVGHRCCFRASVIDTQTSQTICECYEIEDAKRIARALNRSEML